jgi:hypothetical protein
MPIQEDKSLYNSLITSILKTDRHLEVYRNGGDVEIIDYTLPQPDFDITDENNKNFIKHKQRIFEVNTLSDYSDPVQRDIAILPDKSRYVWSGSSWVKIMRDVVDRSSEIVVDNYEYGKLYQKDSVVYMNGHMFISEKLTDTSPIQYASHWRLITELDMFINRCELTTPKLLGYFDVSGSPYVLKVVEITDLNTFQQFFNQNDRNGYNDLFEDNEGTYLSAKDSNVSEMNYWRDIDNSLIKIFGIKIEGTIKKNSSIGSIKLDLDNEALLEVIDVQKDYTDVLLHKYSSDPKIDEYYATEDAFDLYIDTRSVGQYNKINLKFEYDNNEDLSKHRISKITIIYEEK